MRARILARDEGHWLAQSIRWWLVMARPAKLGNNIASTLKQHGNAHSRIHEGERAVTRIPAALSGAAFEDSVQDRGLL
jgi:hypothetical protein